MFHLNTNEQRCYSIINPWSLSVVAEAVLMLAKAAKMVVGIQTTWHDFELLKMVSGARYTDYLHESSKAQTIAATPHRDGQEQP